MPKMHNLLVEIEGTLECKRNDINNTIDVPMTEEMGNYGDLYTITLPSPFIKIEH